MSTTDSPFAPALGVAVVAASPVIRGGLTHVLAKVPDLRLRYSVGSLTDLPTGLTDAGFIVLDLGGHAAIRMDATFWAHLPAGSRTLVLCRPDDPPSLIAALRGGVHALLTREFDIDEFLQAMATARQGGLHISADLFGPLIDRTVPRPTDSRQDLAHREVETLKWIAAGLTHGQIGRRMGLTEATVSTYVKRIRNKLNAGNKAELTRRAIELGYVHPR